MIKEYEILYIIPNEYTEAEIPGITAKIKDLIKSNEAEIIRDETLGKRKLAYPVKNSNHGYYILHHIKTEPSRLKKLDNDLKLAEEVLRHIIVNLADLPPFNLEPEPVQPDRASQKPRPAARPAYKTESPAPAAKSEPAKKISMEELDKKLDEILENPELNI